MCGGPNIWAPGWSPTGPHTGALDLNPFFVGPVKFFQVAWGHGARTTVQQEVDIMINLCLDNTTSHLLHE